MDNLNNFNDFIYGILAAVVIAVFEKLLTAIVSSIANRNHYSINGFWVTKYISAFDPDIKANDLVRIYFYKNKFFITYQQYHNKTVNCKIFKGEGYIGNTGRIAIIYNISTNTIYQNGVMILAPIDIKSTKKGYAGKFYELDSRDITQKGNEIQGSGLKIYDIDYLMIRFKLTFKQKCKFFLNMPVFTPTELEKEFERCYNE